MKEDKLPSYVQLLDYYKRTKTEDTVLADPFYIPMGIKEEANKYMNKYSNSRELRKYSIELAVKNTYGSVFPFAEQIYDYIMEGKIPENVKPEKNIAPSKD